ncbi:MAG: hypothetical protein P1U87_22715 [Verrucomicrobiales bacterium]|nr:hypothetical protein [Verrucomicrobiales bacterium]
MMKRIPLILLAGLLFPGSAQDKKVDEFEKAVEEQIEKRIVKEARAEAEGVPLPPGIMIICEFIEVEAMDFSDWLLENPITTDATPLRMEVQKWVKSAEAKIIETMAVHARSGQRAKVEAIHEWMYPTEYDPPMGVAAKEGEERKNLAIVPATPTAFEVRNVGFTFEVDPVLGADGNLIDLNLAPEIVIADENSEHVTTMGETEAIIEMPRFLTSKVTTQVTMRSGDYSFLGTSRLGKTKLSDAEDPILLMFVRCDVSGGD